MMDEYAEASIIVDKERSMHAPSSMMAIGPHLDYEAQPKLPPLMPIGQQMFELPSDDGYGGNHAAMQAAMSTTKVPRRKARRQIRLYGHLPNVSA
jgi:hypothetical protein